MIETIETAEQFIEYLDIDNRTNEEKVRIASICLLHAMEPGDRQNLCLETLEFSGESDNFPARAAFISLASAVLPRIKALAVAMQQETDLLETDEELIDYNDVIHEAPLGIELIDLWHNHAEI